MDKMTKELENNKSLSLIKDANILELEDTIN